MTQYDRIKLEKSWKEALSAEFEQPYMQQLSNFLRDEKQQGKEIYPPGSLIFNALNLTPLPAVKVVRPLSRSRAGTWFELFGARRHRRTAVIVKHVQRTAARFKYSY